MSKEVPTIDEVSEVLRKAKDANKKERKEYGIILNNYLQNMKQIISEAVQAGYLNNYGDDDEYDLIIKILMALGDTTTRSLRKVHNEIMEKIIIL